MLGSRKLTRGEVKVIKKYLIDLEWSASTLAKKLGCDRANISMILNRKRNMTPKLAEKISHLGIYFY